MANQGRRDEARSMLTDIYTWFTQGFDIPDLKGSSFSRDLRKGAGLEKARLLSLSYGEGKRAVINSVPVNDCRFCYANLRVSDA
jgi:hypothetical protein